MNLIFKGFSAVVLSLSAVSAFASPVALVTYNETNFESNAFIAGVPSIYPTPAKSKREVYWNLVKLACYGHLDAQRRCPAVIKMATNTGKPIEIGTVTMDLNTGDISPKQISNQGFTLTVKGPGQALITKN